MHLIVTLDVTCACVEVENPRGLATSPTDNSAHYVSFCHEPFPSRDVYKITFTTFLTFFYLEAFIMRQRMTLLFKSELPTTARGHSH